MSSTPTTLKICCEQYDNPRVYVQFINNHTLKLPLRSPSEDDLCAVCYSPYGSENLTVRMLDMPVAGIHLPGCKNVFGAACIQTLRCDPEQGHHQHCSFCRTEWWSKDDVTAHTASEKSKDMLSEQLAGDLQTDYITARYMVYREEEFADKYSPLALEELSKKLRVSYYMKEAVSMGHVQKRIRDRQQTHDITLAEVMYDPRDELNWSFAVDPFTFNNYHLNASVMAFAIFRTVYSWRGLRLLDMYHDQYHSAQGDADVVYLRVGARGTGFNWYCRCFG